MNKWLLIGGLVAFFFLSKKTNGIPATVVPGATPVPSIPTPTPTGGVTSDGKIVTSSGTVTNIPANYTYHSSGTTSLTTISPIVKIESGLSHIFPGTTAAVTATRITTSSGTVRWTT